MGGEIEQSREAPLIKLPDFFTCFYLGLYLGFYLYSGVGYLYGYLFGGDGLPLPVLGDIGHGHADEVVEKDEVLPPVLLHDVAHAGAKGFHEFKVAEDSHELLPLRRLSRQPSRRKAPSRTEECCCAACP